MSPSANGANPTHRRTSFRMVKVTVSKPKDGNTKLTINPNPDPAAPKMLISNQGGNVALTTALGQVCGGNPIEGTPYQDNWLFLHHVHTSMRRAGTPVSHRWIVLNSRPLAARPTRGGATGARWSGAAEC